MNKYVLRYNDKDKVYYLLEQNGTKDNSKFWIQISIYNREFSLIGRDECISQVQLREYWIKVSSPVYCDTVERFLVKNKEYNGMKRLTRIPYSVFVKEW